MDFYLPCTVSGLLLACLIFTTTPELPAELASSAAITVAAR